MLEIADVLDSWLVEGRSFAVATVIDASASTPRAAGAALAVDAEGVAVGSVSGGCVEGAVYELCAQALRDGGAVRERFGYSDDDALAVGLTCGGTVEVLVTPVAVHGSANEAFRAAYGAVVRDEAVALVRVVEGPVELLGRAVAVRPDGSYVGSLGRLELDLQIVHEARSVLKSGGTGTLRIVDDLEARALTVFVESSSPAPRMIIFGAVDFASALAGLGKFLGYHVTVCDARAVFATRARFPAADDVVVDWPHRFLRRTETDTRTVLCVLTHEAKFDIPLLEVALRLPVAYVGAMGSRRTHAERTRRLRAAGLGESELARLRSPIGLDLGSRTPQETALSIAAEIVATREGGTGLPLVSSDMPIHRQPMAEPRPESDATEYACDTMT